MQCGEAELTCYMVILGGHGYYGLEKNSLKISRIKKHQH